MNETFDIFYSKLLFEIKLKNIIRKWNEIIISQFPLYITKYYK